MKHSSCRLSQAYIITILLKYVFSLEKEYYISTEHPVVNYYNPKYISYARLTAQRNNRRDPIYYFGFKINLTGPVAYNISMNFYFYEWLTNQYKRGFVEMHFELCDLVHNNEFFGAPMRQGGLEKPCPYPAGVYTLSNMSVPVEQVPHNFPFRKGRIYLNATSMDTNELVGACHIDMEIKQYRIKHKKH